MVIIMRSFPNAGSGKNIPAENGHHDIGGKGIHQYRLMLMIVINNEHPNDYQSGKIGLTAAENTIHRDKTGRNCRQRAK